jgi:nucleoside-diphosphate-sugar epimerase
LTRREAIKPGYLVHTTGSGILVYQDVVNARFGQSSDTIYNDLEGVSDIISLPDFASARGAERAVRNVSVEHPEHVKSAIVCLGSVYGQGRGVKSYRSASVHELARVTLQKGHGVQINEGKSAWGNVYIRDVSDLYLKLVEDAVTGGKATEPPVWGPEGFYLVENGEHVWEEVVRRIVEETAARGLIQSTEIKSISPDEAAALDAHQVKFFWGANSRIRGKRARQALKWQPSGPPLNDEIPLIITNESAALGLQTNGKLSV